MLAACLMIEEHNLCVLLTDDFFTGGTITGISDLRVYVNHLSVAKVSELKAEFRVWVRPEVGGVVDEGHVRVPVVEGEVGVAGQEQLLLHEDLSEVLCLHPICQVNISAHFVSALFLCVSDKHNRGHSAVSESLFTLGKRHKERVSFNGASSVSECLHI
jgi:hypothetical protein